MKGNLLGLLFTILSGALIALIVIAYGRSDKTPPEFRFSAVNLVYDSETVEKTSLWELTHMIRKTGILLRG